MRDLAVDRLCMDVDDGISKKEFLCVIGKSFIVKFETSRLFVIYKVKTELSWTVLVWLSVVVVVSVCILAEVVEVKDHTIIQLFR